ncbi:MAG: MATE family efflux transporter, partial [Lachnospiraceae bacterium]|nr:MATE family efflux transporter [Lachnospiraceae bacterium]
MTKDMTEGNAVKLILRFMVPLVLGNLFQQLYNVADSVIVGRYLGVNALAGVGQSASLTFLILGFVNGCCSGFAIPVAQCFGAKQYSQMRRFVFNAEILSVILAAVITTGT